MSLPSFQYAMYHSLRRHDLTAHLYAGFGAPQFYAVSLGPGFGKFVY